jgi:hypothetical protein
LAKITRNKNQTKSKTRLEVRKKKKRTEGKNSIPLILDGKVKQCEDFRRI